MAKNAKNPERVTILLDPELVKRVDAKATKAGRSRSNFIERVLLAALDLPEVAQAVGGAA
jgi:predicted transcriptional regulator